MKAWGCASYGHHAGAGGKGAQLYWRLLRGGQGGAGGGRGKRAGRGDPAGTAGQDWPHRGGLLHPGRRARAGWPGGPQSGELARSTPGLEKPADPLPGHFAGDLEGRQDDLHDPFDFGLALLGLCFGYTIHISGKGTEGWGDKVNQVMDQIGDVVSDAVGQFRRDRKNKRQKK